MLSGNNLNLNLYIMKPPFSDSMRIYELVTIKNLLTIGSSSEDPVFNA